MRINYSSKRFAQVIKREALQSKQTADYFISARGRAAFAGQRLCGVCKTETSQPTPSKGWQPGKCHCNVHAGLSWFGKQRRQQDVDVVNLWDEPGLVPGWGDVVGDVLSMGSQWDWSASNALPSRKSFPGHPCHVHVGFVCCIVLLLPCACLWPALGHVLPCSGPMNILP